jgi:hypothetical protein
VTRYATADAAKGWRDLAATIRNPLAEAWDFLTRTPLTKTPTNYPLRGELGTSSPREHERGVQRAVTPISAVIHAYATHRQTGHEEDDRPMRVAFIL